MDTIYTHTHTHTQDPEQRHRLRQDIDAIRQRLPVQRQRMQELAAKTAANIEQSRRLLEAAKDRHPPEP